VVRGIRVLRVAGWGIRVVRAIIVYTIFKALLYYGVILGIGVGAMPKEWPPLFGNIAGGLG